MATLDKKLKKVNDDITVAVNRSVGNPDAMKRGRCVNGLVGSDAANKKPSVNSSNSRENTKQRKMSVKKMMDFLWYANLSP